MSLSVQRSIDLLSVKAALRYGCCEEFFTLHDSDMRILITGAAGKVGKGVRKELATAGHQLRLADIAPVENPEGESIKLDIADSDTVRRAMEGIEAVAHLAYGPIRWSEPNADDIRKSFDVNVKGTFNLLWAAKQAGVKRFVYSTTLSVFGKSLNDLPEITEQTPPSPDEIYGLTKLLGELNCKYFSGQQTLGIVCLRLCHVCDDADWEKAVAEKPGPARQRWRVMATHVSDVARAIHLALTTPNLQYELINIASDNANRFVQIQRAKDVLGFWPQRKLD